MASNKKDTLRVEGIHCRYNRYKDYNRNTNDKHQVPFLVRTIWKHGPITLEEFNQGAQELQLYLFMGSTLRDIVDQLKYQLDGVYRRDIVFKLYNIFLDQHGIQKKKELGSIHSVKSRKDDDLKLKDCGFKIGDILIVDIDLKKAPPQVIKE